MIYFPCDDKETNFFKVFWISCKRKGILAKTKIKRVHLKHAHTHGTSFTAQKSHFAVTQCIRLLDQHNKVLQTEWRKQQKFIFSQFGRPDVWDQGIRRVGFFWVHAPWPRRGGLLPVCSRRLSSVHTHVCVQISSFYKDTGHIGIRPTLKSSF